MPGFCERIFVEEHAVLFQLMSTINVLATNSKFLSSSKLYSKQGSSKLLLKKENRVTCSLPNVAETAAWRRGFSRGLDFMM